MFCSFLRVKNCRLQTELHPDSIPWEQDFPLERQLFPPARLCRAEREAGGTTETVADCHPPAAPHGRATGAVSAAAKPPLCRNRCCLQNIVPGREHLCRWNRMLPKQLLPQRERQQTYLDPGTGTSASSGLRQPPARPLSLTYYAFPSPTPPSVLRSVQHSPPSPDCCCLRTAEIKGGGMEEDRIFSKPSNWHCIAVVEIKPAPPASTLADLPLSSDCTVVLLCTAKLTCLIIGLWQILDSSPQWHPNMQVILIHSYSGSRWRNNSLLEKQFPILDEAVQTQTFL